jgi:rubrerythrin
MFEEAELAEQFNALLDQEQQAADYYATMASKTDDPQVRRLVEQVHREKKRHIQLTQRLLEIVD